MLSVATPDLWTPEIFTFPVLPDLDPTEPTTSDFENITSFVNEAVPLVTERPVYRASLAENEGGSCYAQAEAVVGMLATLGINKNFVELGFPHANNVSAISDGPVYLDSQFERGQGLQVRTTPLASGNFTQEVQTSRAHREFIESLTDGEPAACYVWFDDYGNVRTHVVEESIDEITDAEMNTAPEHNPHIIITGPEGVAMLHAIGDLKRYRSKEYVRKNGTEKFETAQNELGHLVPAFVKVSAPDVSLVGV